MLERAIADDHGVIWPAAALALLLLGFVVAYGSTLQARLEAAVRGAASDAPTDVDPTR